MPPRPSRLEEQVLMSPRQPYMSQQPIIFGNAGVTMICPHCNRMISSVTSKSHGTCTHLCCCLLFCTVGCSLCSCLPYFFCEPVTVEHSCPNCKAKLGVWNK